MSLSSLRPDSPAQSKPRRLKPRPEAERNPGCEYCIYYLDARRAGSDEGVCMQNARRVSKQLEDDLVYKWVECEKPAVKNCHFHCPEFKFRNFLSSAVRRLLAMLDHKKYSRCAFLGEEWWNLPK